MNHKLVVAVLSAIVWFVSQAQAQMSGQTGHHGSSHAKSSPSNSGNSRPDQEAKAEELRLDGKCEEAIPIFRTLAAKGVGYEISEFNLGLCLFDIGKAETDAQRVASLKHEAAEWILKAANQDFPNAQSSLVAIYLNGNGVDIDPVEAGKWSRIYHANGMRLAIGLPDNSPDLQARLDRVLNEKNWAEAQSRATTWSAASQNGNDKN
jgi:TPR repeat protein